MPRHVPTPTASPLSRMQPARRKHTRLPRRRRSGPTPRRESRPPSSPTPPVSSGASEPFPIQFPDPQRSKRTMPTSDSPTPIEIRPSVSVPPRVPHVVVVGCGFAGLATIRALRKAPVRLTVIDRSNHHLFQPLLYQVATAILSPAQIAAPIRQVLARQKNATVQMAEVVGVDRAKRVVYASSPDRQRVP